jgi:hypothetical protein
MIRIPRPALGLLVVLTLVPSVARSDTWQPLAVGSRWEYRGVGGAHQVVTITGQTIVRGRVVAVKTYDESPDAGLQNYWLLDADGSVLLAGFYNPGAGYAWAYEPPIRILPVPPAVGPQPSQAIEVHDLFTDALLFADSFRFDVTEDVMLALPAGSYHAFGVGQFLALPMPPVAKGASLTLDGRSVASTGASLYVIDTTDWYSEGVGEVQYKTTDLYQLVGFGMPTPTVKSSWSGIKRLYR